MFDPKKLGGFDAIMETLVADAIRLSGLSRNGAALPHFHDAADEPEAAYFLRTSGAVGMYIDRDAPAPNAGSLLYNTDLVPLIGDTKFASVIVHELTHWLQDVNGKLDHYDARASELPAYQTQAAWLKENGISDPAKAFPEVFKPSFLADRYGAGFYAAAIGSTEVHPHG